MRWSAHIHTAFHVCSATLELPRANSDFGYGGVTLYAASFQKLLLSLLVPRRGPNPREISLVWALPVSLATTCGIDFSFFSSAYWDVSLQRVSRTFSYLPIARTSQISLLYPGGLQKKTMLYYQHQVIPFGNLRIKVYLPLPEAYRSLSRPSSPFSTKASTVCPLKLDFLRILLFSILVLLREQEVLISLAIDQQNLPYS